MTPEEAMKYIIQHCNPDYPKGKTEWETAINMAISALERQIPKKPIMYYQFPEKLRKVIERTNIELAKSKTECCPVCGRPLGISQFVKKQNGQKFGDPHCKRCGQAILWE